jgi:hypothetical protein
MASNRSSMNNRHITCIACVSESSYIPVLHYVNPYDVCIWIWFVLKYLLGYPNVKNYDGSWSEWGNMIANPIER